MEELSKQYAEGLITTYEYITKAANEVDAVMTREGRTLTSSEVLIFMTDMLKFEGEVRENVKKLLQVVGAC